MAEKRRPKYTFAGHGAALSAHEPTYRERVQYALSDLFGSMGADKYRAGDVSRRVTDLAEWTPFGMLTGMDDAQRSYDAGNYGGMALGALSVVPMAGKADDAAKTMWHGVSSAKLRRPLEEMTATYEDVGRMLPQKIASPEDLPVGSTIIPGIGDRTAAGKMLTGINETKFENPVHLQGGMDFMRGQSQIEDGSAWASHDTVIDGIAKRAIKHGKDGNPVFLAYSPMGGESGDFSRMTTNSILEMLRANPVDDAAKKALNKAMRETESKDFAKVPNFDIDQMLRGEGEWMNSGNVRKKLAKLLDKNSFAKLGFPDVGSIRKAVTAEDLLNVETGSGGQAISRIDPTRTFTEAKTAHADYPKHMAGTYIGGFERPIPREIMYPDFMATRKPGENPSQLNRAFSMQDVSQKVNQQWLDRIMAYLQSPEGVKLGIGGAIAAGLLTEDEAGMLSEITGGEL